MEYPNGLGMTDEEVREGLAILQESQRRFLERRSSIGAHQLGGGGRLLQRGPQACTSPLLSGADQVPTGPADHGNAG